MYNLLTGDGFSKAILGGWSVAMLGLAVVFFLVAFANKLSEDFDISWNKGFAWAGAFIGYLLLVTLTGQARWGLVAAFGGLTLGYFGSLFGGGGSW